jgi:hypothetical protein
MRILCRLSLILVPILLGTLMFVPIIPLIDKGYRNSKNHNALSKCRTRPDFEAVLGPSGDYRIDRSSQIYHWNPGEIPIPEGKDVFWTDDYYEIWARVDPGTGRVNRWYGCYSTQENDWTTIFNVIIGWLK